MASPYEYLSGALGVSRQSLISESEFKYTLLLYYIYFLILFDLIIADFTGSAQPKFFNFPRLDFPRDAPQRTSHTDLSP